MHLYRTKGRGTVGGTAEVSANRGLHISGLCVISIPFRSTTLSSSARRSSGPRHRLVGAGRALGRSLPTSWTPSPRARRIRAVAIARCGTHRSSADLCAPASEANGAELDSANSSGSAVSRMMRARSAACCKSERMAVRKCASGGGSHGLSFRETRERGQRREQGRQARGAGGERLRFFGRYIERTHLNIVADPARNYTPCGLTAEPRNRDWKESRHDVDARDRHAPCRPGR